jgi:predicted Ser/Thr protein kinase
VLRKQLGQGNMGTVWLADDELLERAVAIKQLVSGGGAAQLAERRERAWKEAKALARVRHPAIVSIHDVVVADDDPWLVMEYINGRPLDKVIAARRLSPRAVAAIMLPVVHALDVVHRSGVVHRDVKPSNILVGEDDAVTLVDFGIARINGDPKITDHHRVVGTVEYMSPERFSNEEAPPASDLWSLGVTLFYALEGYSPFRRGGYDPIATTMYAICNEDPPEPAQSGGLARLILRLLSRDPLARPSAREVADDLTAFLSKPPPPDLGLFQRGPDPWPGPPDVSPRPLSPAGTLRTPAELRDDHAGDGHHDADEGTRAMRGAGRDAAVAVLLARPPDRIAALLSGYPPAEAAGLLQDIAAVQPSAAAAVLRIWPAPKAARGFAALRLETRAAVLQAAPRGEAARLLKHADDVREAAAALMYVPARIAVGLLAELRDDNAARLLEQMTSAAVVALRDSDAELIHRILGRTSESFRKRLRGHPG